MKILFVDPLRNSTVTDKYTPNTGYLYMASFLKARGYNNVKILDAHAQGMPWKDMLQQIISFKPDILATSSNITDIYKRILLARMVKRTAPSIKIIIGGPHASLVPEEVLRIAGCIDYAIIGEGEITLLELIKKLERKETDKEVARVKGIAYLNEKKFIFTGHRELMDDLDNLPMPDYSMVPVRKYKAYEFYGNPHDTTGVTFSRGCFFRCAFCSEPIMWRHRQRSRSPFLMAEELMILNSEYGKKNFIIGDTDFFFNRERNSAFLREILKRKIKINFSVMTRVNSIIEHRGMLEQYSRAGLSTVRIGVESYSDNSLGKLRKNQNIAQIKEAFYLLKKSKIPIINVFTIWGLAGEGRGAYRSILKNPQELGGNKLTHSFITPLPGTEMFNEFKENGLIQNWDYRSYTYFSPVVKSAYYSKERLRLLQLFIHLAWAYHPKRIIRNLFNRHKLYLQFVFYPRMTAMIALKILSKQAGRWINEEEKQIYLEHLAYHGILKNIK